MQLLYGENRIEIVLYGPQGQVRTREEMINVGQDNVPARKTWYWAGSTSPTATSSRLTSPRTVSNPPNAQATLALEHGIDNRTSVGVLARAMLIDDQRVTFLEGSVRRSIGLALIEVGGARESNGGTAAHAQFLASSAPSTSMQRLLLQMIFICMAASSRASAMIRLALDARSGSAEPSLPAHTECTFRTADGTRQLDAAARLSANFGRFNLATRVTLSEAISRLRSRPPGVLTVGFIGTGHIGDVRLRGEDRLRRRRRGRASPRRSLGLLVGLEHCRLGGRPRL